MELPYTPKKRLPEMFGRKLTAAIAEQGYTTATLAQKADVPLLAVQALETGPECFPTLQAVLGVLNRELIITKDTIVLLERE